MQLTDQTRPGTFLKCPPTWSLEHIYGNLYRIRDHFFAAANTVGNGQLSPSDSQLEKNSVLRLSLWLATQAEINGTRRSAGKIVPIPADQLMVLSSARPGAFANDSWQLFVVKIPTPESWEADLKAVFYTGDFPGEAGKVALRPTIVLDKQGKPLMAQPR